MGAGGAPFVLPDFSPCPQVDGANWVWVVVFVPGQNGDFPSVCLPGSDAVTTPEVLSLKTFTFIIGKRHRRNYSQPPHRSPSSTTMTYSGAYQEFSAQIIPFSIHFWILFMIHICMSHCLDGSDQVEVR